MTIWILTLLLLGCVAGVGSRQGAVRAGASFFGILFGGLLAVPLGHLIKPLFSVAGLKDPLLLWSLPPLVMFAILLTAFKVGGMVVHKKIDVYYRYKTGELRFALWERINMRLGICVGVLNGAAYLILVSWIIYTVSYWTVQTSAGGSCASSR